MVEAKKIQCINQEDSKTLYEEGKLRIHTVSKLIINDGTFGVVAMPLTHGVGIEYKYNEENYLVISFVYVNEKGKVYVRRVGNRVTDYIKHAEGNKELYEKIKTKAKRIVKEALKVNGN
jgi:hypothetical protein